MVRRRKLYCFMSQTILFGSRNNMVAGTFCPYSENEMYSFLKSKADSAIFSNICLQLASGLSGIGKVRVSAKVAFEGLCQAFHGNWLQADTHAEHTTINNACTASLPRTHGTFHPHFWNVKERCRTSRLLTR